MKVRLQMKKEYDYLLVGAGLSNAVFAHQAKLRGKRCLVIDKRKHLGGNLFCMDADGIHVHLYGPHIFHTSNRAVWEYVNTFVDFNRFTLNTIANYKGKIFNLPFNMNTFHQIWNVVKPEDAKRMILKQIEQSGIVNPKNLEETAISMVGQDVYEILIKGYTEKQWGRKCTELPSYIIKRLPVRYTYDNNYFADRYQGIPEGGYNKLINGLLEGTETRINCNYFDDKTYFDSIAAKIVYSGRIDEYFGFRYGRLEYRSLRFESEMIQTDNYQGNAIINYTDSEVPFTRIVEHKHFDINNEIIKNAPYTVITREYPMVSTGYGQEPFYPVNDEKNDSIYSMYKECSRQLSYVLFQGRLAEYRYYDMHQVIENSINYWL